MTCTGRVLSPCSGTCSRITGGTSSWELSPYKGTRKENASSSPAASSWEIYLLNCFIILSSLENKNHPVVNFSTAKQIHTNMERGSSVSITPSLLGTCIWGALQVKILMVVYMQCGPLSGFYCYSCRFKYTSEVCSPCNPVIMCESQISFLRNVVNRESRIQLWPGNSKHRSQIYIYMCIDFYFSLIIFCGRSHNFLTQHFERDWEFI